jgi:hypothetical protein
MPMLAVGAVLTIMPAFYSRRSFFGVTDYNGFTVSVRNLDVFGGVISTPRDNS